MKKVIAAVLAACALPALGQAPGKPGVEVTYIVNERDPAGERALRDLKLHLERRAPRLLAPGQKLSVEILSVYRAGHRSLSPGNAGLRIITDGAPARIELSFTLSDGADKPVAQGTRSLRGPTYFVANSGGDPMHFEKELLDDWLRTEFGPKS